MKRLKVYLALILVLGTLMSMCIGVFATQSPSTVKWILQDVDGEIYATTPFGFIIRNGDLFSLVNSNGYTIPPSTNKLGRINDKGYLPFSNSSGYGIMHANGDITVQPGKYFLIDNFEQNLFRAVVLSEDDNWLEGLIDHNGNEIIVPGQYTYFYTTYGETAHIVAYDSDNKRAILSLEGEVIFPAGEGENVTLMYSPDNDRYLVYDPETDKSYIRGFDGKDIATIDGCASNSVPYVCVTTYDNGYWHSTYYDYNGNLVENPEEDTYAEPEKTPAYRFLYDENWVPRILDKDDNVVFEISDVIINNLHKGKFVHVFSKDWLSQGLYDVYSNVVIPMQENTDIWYSEDADLFGFDNWGNYKVSIAKIEMLTVEVNGKDVNFADQRPFIKDGRTLVPLRAIFEALGAEVTWNGATRTATSTRGDVTVSLTIDSNIMYVNGKAVTLDVPATIVNDRTVVPVRAISEAFGCKVEWNGKYQTAIITD